MTEGKRPGGLTALAVINFIFGANEVFSGLATPFAGKVIEFAGEHDAEALRIAEMWQAIPLSVLWSAALLRLVTGGLMIASGVGYLSQKKFLGRTLGNAFILASLGYSALWALGVKDSEIGGGFNLYTIISVIYPVLTLVLINTTFKEDFVN